MDQWERERRQAEALMLREHCGRFSRMGWALFAMAVVSQVVQYAAVGLAQVLAPGLAGNMVFLWALNLVSVYLLGFPAFAAVIRGLPAPGPARGTEDRPLGAVRFFQVYCISLAGLYLSNYVTLGLTGLIGRLRGVPVSNPAEIIVGYPAALSLILACVVAPVVEELIFRKLLLERLRPYGDKFAMCASALCFGLFHGNLSQFLYAFVIGLIFAYVVLRTGRVWQSMLLHAMVNFVSAGLVPLLEPLGTIGAAILGLFVLGMIFQGIVFFIALRRELWFRQGNTGFREARKWELFFGNPGMIFFCVVAGLTIVSSLLVL